jgi:hypothetical protein
VSTSTLPARFAKNQSLFITARTVGAGGALVVGGTSIDIIEHATDGTDCPCSPSTQAVFREDGSNGWIVTHSRLQDYIDANFEEFLESLTLPPRFERE